MRRRTIAGLIVYVLILAGCMSRAPAETPAGSPAATTALINTPAAFPVSESPAAAYPAAYPAAIVPPTEMSASYPTVAVRPEESAASSPLFPGLDLKLETNLPGGTTEAKLYFVRNDRAPEAQEAAQIAGRLGVDGALYSEIGLPGRWLVQDEGRRVHLLGSPRRFDLSLAPSISVLPPECEPPCAAPGADAKVEGFLQDGDLAETDFRLEPSARIPGRFDLRQYIDGYPLFTAEEDRAAAQTGSDGSLARLQYRAVQPELLRSAGLHSAEQAWQALLDGTAKVIFNEYPTGSPQAQTWTRRYRPGAERTFYGTAQAFEPAAGSGEAVILLNDYPLTGATQGLAQAAAGGRIIEAWGRVEEDDPNGPRLALTGWQASVYPEQTIEGRLQRSGREAYLATDATRYWLPDAPDEIAEAVWLTTRGVMPEAEEPTIQWWSLTEGPAQNVRAGGRGFQSVGLYASQPPYPTRAANGRVEEMLGTVEIIAHAYSDGSSQVEVQFGPTSAAAGLVRLDGAGLQGVDAYQNLPIRIWGTAEQAGSGLTTIDVERFEPEYPDTRVEAWLGLVHSRQFEGHDPVWMLTTPDGEEFVLGSTQAGKSPPISPEMRNDPLIIEGVQFPGNVFEGYPVISDLAWLSGVGRNDLDGYQPVSAQPRVVQELGSAGARRVARIDSVALVYLLTEDPTLYTGKMAQPAWRFAGRLDDGAAFEIFVQALLEV